MSKNISNTELQIQHNAIYSKCESFCKEVVHQILHIIETENLQLAVPIQHRAKSWSSVVDKIEQGRFNIKKSILELQDLSGIRIILLFQRDVIKVTELIKAHFDVLKEYNTEDNLAENQFGYSSIHLILKLNSHWLLIPTLSNYTDLKFEVQIRTLSQHSWAEASNIFQYKQEDNIPKPLKRSISRISALLETVDLEYERLLSERENYKIEIKDINTFSINIPLNVDLLEEILDKILPKQNKEDLEPYSNLLEDLQILEYATSEKLTILLKKNLEEAIKIDQKAAQGLNKQYLEEKEIVSNGYQSIKKNDVKRFKNGYFLTHVGLVRCMLGIELGQHFREAIKAKIDTTNRIQV